MTPSQLSFPEMVIFDWDNTLIDSNRITLHAINRVLIHFGKEPLTLERYLAQPSISIRDYFQALFPPPHYEEAEALYTAHVQGKTVLPFDFSLPLLKWLQEVQVPMAVVSNKEGRLLREEIQHLEWQEYFYCAVGSYDTAQDKPSPVPLLYALSQKSTAPGHHVWFVGDSIVDMHCAGQAGCLPVAVGPQAEQYAEVMLKVGHGQGLYELLKALHGSSVAGQKKSTHS